MDWLERLEVTTDVLFDMEEAGLVKYDPETGCYSLTKKGEAEALRIEAEESEDVRR